MHTDGTRNTILSLLWTWFWFCWSSWFIYGYAEHLAPCLVLASVSSQMLLPVRASCIMKVKYIPWVP